MTTPPTSQAPATAPEVKRPERRLRRWTLAAVLLAALALAAAGCGGGGSPSSSGSTSGGGSSSGGASAQGTSDADSAQQSGIAYAQCMRSHGVSNFPDNAISSSGGGTEVKLPPGVSSNPDYQSATQACKSKLPNGGNASGGANNAHVQAEINWANCMRSHGVANAPEPNSQGAIIMGGGSGGVNPNSPTFQAANQACRHYLPNGGTGAAG